MAFIPSNYVTQMISKLSNGNVLCHTPVDSETRATCNKCKEYVAFVEIGSVGWDYIVEFAEKHQHEEAKKEESVDSIKSENYDKIKARIQVFIPDVKFVLTSDLAYYIHSLSGDYQELAICQEAMYVCKRIGMIVPDGLLAHQKYLLGETKKQENYKYKETINKFYPEYNFMQVEESEQSKKAKLYSKIQDLQMAIKDSEELLKPEKTNWAFPYAASYQEYWKQQAKNAQQANSSGLGALGATGGQSAANAYQTQGAKSYTQNQEFMNMYMSASDWKDISKTSPQTVTTKSKTVEIKVEMYPDAKGRKFRDE